MIKVGVVGATGYAGSELVRLLAAHPAVEIAMLVSRSEAGKALAELMPNLNGLSLPPLQTLDIDLLANSCDVVLLAQETGFAMEYAPTLLAQGLKVIDLSADFRLKEPAVFEEWYRMPHTAPHLLQESLYGLSELVPDEAYTGAHLIANPGCYPTAGALALAPLILEDMIELSQIIIDAKSGVSGAGRSRVQMDYLFTELDENFKAYSVIRHRHTPEIEQTLAGIRNSEFRIRFTPHLVPMTRGILCTAYASLKHALNVSFLQNLYEDFYAAKPFICVRSQGDFPATKHVYGSNRCDIGVGIDERTGHAIVISVIDNLIKGAAGQAVQNLNRLFGWEETLGLPIPAIAP
jgi:N-acetyl-gamma-glutamyl-phosphate reductase